jgi:hypothetical protein
MYLALRSGQPDKTRTEKGAEIHRVYFLDMVKCLAPEADREEAVVSVPESLQVTSDFGRKVELDISTSATVQGFTRPRTCSARRTAMARATGGGTAFET